MKQVKVTLQDPHTILLLEDANKGDTIDLRSIHEVNLDLSSISNIVKSVRDTEFVKQLEDAKKNIEQRKSLEAKIRENEIVNKAKNALEKKDQEIVNITNNRENEIKIAIQNVTLSFRDEKQALQENYQKQLSAKESQIQELKILKDTSEKALINFKEMKSRMSTKMIGNSLETHCENEFNRLRPVAFPHSYFEPDHDAKSGSKGDYIYREYDPSYPDRVVLSIMFDMKNEMETTEKKHKNKDFFKELDKDRIEKDCEYAVLVSLLEKENEYYDDIVTVHEYSKMYVIRPQHFITIIGFLRQANLKSQELMRTIYELKNRNIDVNTFESNLNSFKEGFSRNYKLASTQFASAIDEIDNAISRLNKVKEYLQKSAKNLTHANNKLDDVTIRRLTAGSPSVAQAFANAGSK